MQTKIVLRADDSIYLYNTLTKNFENLNFKVRKIKGGMECRFENDEFGREALNKTVREYIVDNLEENEIEKIISREYKFLSADKRKLFKNTVKNAIDTEENIQQQLFVVRRNRIIENITDKYFRENSNLNIEGFIPFWLKNYSIELKGLVDYSAEEFALMQEYEEFILLLKEYLYYAPHIYKTVSIVAEKDYKLFDENNREIKNTLKTNDELIGFLIENNPQYIIIHKPENMKKEIYRTIFKVFGTRCIKCTGCKLCGKSKC